MLTRLVSKQPEQRQAILARAVAENHQLVAAVLNANSWLSELTEAEIALVRHAWARSTIRRMSTALPNSRRRLSMLARAGLIALGFVDTLTDQKLISAAEVMERRATEALASGA